MSSYTDRLNELKKKYVSAEREEEKKTKPTAPVGSSYRDRLDALKEKYPEGTSTKKKAQSTLSQIEKLDSSINKQKNRVNTNRGRSAGLSATKPTAAETKLRQDLATRNEQRRELLSIDADKIENNKNRDAVLGAQLKVAKDQAREAGYVNPRSKTSSAKKAEKTEAQKQLSTINKDKSRTEKLVRYEDKVYADTFGGQTGANFAVGRLSQDSSLAWSEYLDNPTEKNRRYAESLDATLQSFMTRNEKALDDENVKLSWVSKSLANYMPQFLDQASYSIQGGIAGAAAGTLIAPGAGTVKGAKVGVTMASGAYSYKTMRGAAFKALIESGVSEETARAAAADEAFVSALIEMADTGIDMLTLGGSSLLTALGKSGWKGVGKLATEWAGQDTVKRFALAAAKYGLNVGSEALEEATQEAVSIANQNRVQRGEKGKGSLVGAASKVFRDALTGTNKEAADQIWAAATEGAKIAAMMGGADVITTQTTAQIVSRVQAESVGAGIRAAGKELDMLAQAKTDYGKDTKTYKLATTLESQMKSSGRTTLTDLETGRLFEQMTRDDAEAQVKAENKVKKESTAAKKTAKVDAQTEADLVEMATSEDQATAEYAAAQLSNPEVTVVSPVAQKLMSAGVKNDVAVEQAALVQKMQAGHKLTDAEIQKLRVSDPAVQATIEAETGVKVPGTTKAAKRQLNQSIIKTAAEVKAQRERARQAVAEQQAGEVLVAQARANAQAAADAAAPATEAVPSETVVTPTGNPATGDSEANVSSDAAVATLLDLLEESKGDRVMASALQQNTIEFADGTVQNYVDFVESYKAEHKGATDEDATRVFYEWKRQNQMGQKVPGTAKQTKSSAAAKTEQKASVGETGETPAEVRFFAGKQLSKEAAAEAKRLEQESLKKFGEFLGVEVEFQEFDGADADANGFYLKEQNKVVLNAKKLNGLRHTTRIFLHEVTHPAQDADVNLTRDILNLVKEARGEGYLNMLIKRTKDAYVAFYKKNNYDLGTLNVASEVAADYMMNIFESRAALDRIAGVKPSLVSKMLKRLGVIRRAGGLDASVASHLDKLADRMVEAQRKAKEQKSTATKDSAEKRYSLVGITADGIEVFETSQEVRNMSYAQRMEVFTALMQDVYRGRTAKFTTSDGEVYYAVFDSNDLRKNVYGDKRSTKKGWKAKISTGADGSIFELIENATHQNSAEESGKKTKSHRGVTEWGYFVKKVQIDNTVFDLLANVRKKLDGEYVYSIQLKEDKNKAPAPPLRYFESNAQSGDVHSAEVPTNASATNITDSSSDVKKQFSVDSEGNQLSTKQQEFFKDSKVRDKEGKLLPVYHGTPSGGFTEFKLPEYFSVMNSAQGAGYYFTDKRNASQYKKGVAGKSGVKPQLYQVYLNITNPMEIEQFSTGIITDEVFRAIAARGNYAWGVQHTDVEKILRNNKFDADRLAELVRLFRGEDILTAMREVTGYDGVRYTDKWGDIWVAWDKSQIKNTDNKAPTADPDIRYSLLDDVSIDDLLKMSDAEFQQLYVLLGVDEYLADDKFLLDDDFSVEEISDELNTEPEIIQVLYRRNGLGASHVEDGHKAVMTRQRIDQRIKEHGASQADYARRYITRISPKDFIDLTVYERNMDRVNFDSRVGGDFGSKMGEWDYEKELREHEEPPVLIVDKSTGQVIGHNGRHRVRALEMAGIKSVEIEVEFHDADGYMIKYNSETIPDMAISSQFDTAIETRLSNIIPLNKAHRDEILASYGETAHEKAAVKYSIDANSVGDRGERIAELHRLLERASAKRTNAYAPLLTELTEFYRNQGLSDPKNAAEGQLRDLDVDRFESLSETHGYPEVLKREMERYVETVQAERLVRLQLRTLNPTDRDYMDAVNRGAMDTVQQMVDEAAKAAGYDAVVYHGTPGFGFTKIDVTKSDDGISFFATDSSDVARTYSDYTGVRRINESANTDDLETTIDSYEEKAYEFVDTVNRTAGVYNYMPYDSKFLYDLRIGVEAGIQSYAEASGKLDDFVEETVRGLYDCAAYYDAGLMPEAFYESDEAQAVYEAAEELYPVLRNLAYLANNNVGNYEMFANTEGLFEIDAKNNYWSQIPFDQYDPEGLHPVVNTRELAQYAKDGGYAGVKITNVYDDGGRSIHAQERPATVYIFFDPQKQVKSADPVTYDENGNIIPLSKRFNEKNEDIRYSIGLSEPWVPDWVEDPTLLDADLSEMSVEQRDFFADSKARDEHGRLIPMYHGTNTPTFTVFDPSFSDDKRSLFFSSNPGVADTYTRQQDEGRDVDPYNLITEDSTAEQFNAAQEYVGGGLRVVKVTEEWNAEMRQKHKEAEKRYFDGALALAKHAQELAGDDEVLRNFFNYDVERIKSSIESDLSSRFSMIEGALDNIVNYADAISYRAERTLRNERIDLRKLDDARQMYRDSILPEEEFGKYLMTETNEMVEFRVEGKENYRFTHFIPGTEKEMVKRAIERSHWVAEHSLGNRYQVYLNLKNPMVVECGTDYSGRKDVNIYHDYHEPDTYYVQLDDAEDSLSVTLSRMELVPFIIRTFDEENRMTVLNQLQADFEAYKDKWGDLDESQVDHNITLRDVEVNYVQPSYWNSIPFRGRKDNTRAISAWAKDEGYDGVIFKNLKDTGGWAAADPGASTVMIAFKSNQVKATTNRKPTEDKDIRYSVNSLAEEIGDEVLTQGMTVTEDGKRYSIRSMRHDIADGKMFKDLMKHCSWTQEEVDDLQGKLEHLLEIMEPHRDILDLNETFGRDEREFSPYKANSDPLYKISMDFSTLCSKRLLTQYVIENLQLQENRPMSAEEQMAIRDLLIEYGKQEKALQVACTMCYVEAARLKAPEQMNRWLADPGYFVRDYFGKKNKAYKAQVKRAQEDFKESKGYDRNAAKKQMSSADVTALNLIGPEMYAKYKPSAHEQQIIERAKKLPASTYLTADNLARLSENEPEIYDAYVTCIRDATRSKALETAVPYYYGDSKRKVGKKGKTVSDKFIAAVNSENGMRFSSWSDWRIQHLLDFITAVIENSVRGAAMHGYTKYVDEVRVLGKTGMMFNMSGVPTGQTGLDENGNLLFSETDSVDIDAAKQARNEFPETSGIQCIGVSDDHIRKLLQSDFIDYVIPYHVSGMNADLRRMGGIHKWEDYTDVQHAKALRDNAGKEPTFSEFFVGYNTSLSGIDAMKASAERYKRLCKERGLTPKFNDFAGEENYWKLLVDRKMVNQVTGQLIEQKPVKADFDFGLIEQIVGQFVKNFDSGLESRALAYVKKNWDSIPSRIEELKKRDEAKPKSKGKKKKSTPVDRAAKTLANATLAAQPKQYSVDSSAHNTDTGYEEGSIQDRVLTLLKSGTVDDAVTLLQEWADELTSGRVEAKPEERAFRDALMAKRKVSPEMAAANRRKLDDLVEDFGKIAPGEKRTREVIIPAKVAEGRGVSKHVRTVLESEHTPEWFVAEAERLVAENAEGYTYDIATDRAAMRHIQDRKSRSFQRNLQEWEDTFNSVDKAITKNDIALGEFLYTEAVKAGDVATATRLVAELSAAGTRAGQTVQAMSLLKKLTPSGQLYYLQQAVERLNRDLKKQGKEQKIIVDADLAKALIEAKTTEEMQKAMDALLQDIANQAPVTVMDKWNAWRYLAMLGNPRTHIRNIASNAVFAPAVFLKDIIGAAAQLPMAKENRTKNLGQAFASLGYGATFGKVKTSPYVEFADADFAAMADVIRGGGKQNPADLIRDKRPIFKGKATQWINKASKANSQWMESEDAIFLKWHYVRALSQYLAAQDADLSTLETTPEGRNQLVQAREWAVQEAQKATFRDASAFASALSQFEHSNRAAGVLVGGLLPFKKTPINILKRGVEYSPLGMLNTLYKGMTDKTSAAKFVDGLASSLTGTGIMAMGIYLAMQGLLRGSGSGDEKEEAFEELQGAQDYSLQLGDGTSFTIDWMAPAALPLFVGCEIYKVMSSEGEFSAADFTDSLMLIAEPMFNLSMLDGLNNTLKTAGYSDSPLTAVGSSILTGYVGQAVPTLLGQIARTMDGTRRGTYIDKNKDRVDLLDRTLQYNQTKIPVASESLVPKLDAWGRPDTQASWILGALENFLSPGYVNSKKTSPMENELMRLYKATGSSAVLPKAAAKYFTVGGKRYDLSGEEWTTFQTELGQGSYEMLTRLVNSRAYGSLSDAQKVKAVEDVYEYAKEQAKTAAVGSYVSDKSWVAKAEKLAGKGVSVEDYIMYSVIGSETSGQNTLDIVGITWLDDTAKAQLISSAYAKSLTGGNTFTDPYKTGYQYIMTSAQVERYLDQYETSWMKEYRSLIATNQYKAADNKAKADMLDKLKSSVATDTKKWMARQLSNSGIKSTKKP